MPVPQPDRVTVWWDDAHMYANHADHKDVEHKYHRPYHVASTGWLVKEDKAGVTVAYSWNPPNGGFEPWDYRDVHFFPKGIIRKVEHLRGERNRKH